MNGLLQDTRYALRQLRKSSGFALVAVVTLAIGMGATTAIFSVVDSLLLRPLPYPNSSRVVSIWNTFAPRGMTEIPLSEPELNEYRQSQSFAHVAGFSTGALTLTGTSEPLRVLTSWVTSDFFSVFGTQPFRGRVFSSNEYQPGQAQVVVLSYRLWMSRFDGSSIIGKTITLNGQNCIVVGIMPRIFAFPSEETDVWQPLPISPLSSNLGNHYLGLVGDLKPGVTLKLAMADMATMQRRIQQKYPAYYRQAVGIGVRLVPLREQMVGDLRPTILMLLASVGFILLIACTNVANLLLARGEKHKVAIAARVALGATHWRILRQILTENLVIFLMGGSLGILFAFFSTRILSLQNEFKINQIGEIGFDWRVFVFAATTCLLTGLIFGFIPALQASHSNFSELLKTVGQNAISGRRRARTRSLLVSSEIALSLVLLTGAGLMISSLSRLLGVNLGFSPENVITMRLSLPEKDYSLHQTVAFYQEIDDRIQRIPGIKSAAIVNQLPMSEVSANTSFEVEGRPLGADVNVADTNLISPNYFHTMQISLLRGRAFSADDPAKSNSTIVNQAFAQKIWPGVDPIGKRIRLRPDAPWLMVVGEAADIKNHGVNMSTKPELYFPYTDEPIGLWTDFRTATLVVRTSLGPEQIVGAVRAQLHDLDSNLPIYKVTTLSQIVSSSVSGTRLPALLLSFFAFLAVALAAIGIYGVLTYIVAQSRREIGLRMALGATREKILGLFVWQALRWTALGGGAGLIAALILVRYMRSLLFQISPFDSKVFLFAIGILASVTFLAIILPARRAAKVDPMVALRYE